MKEMACAARRHRFTAAVYHHLCAIRIQRAVRAHWALKSTKRKISSVLYIQVHLIIEIKSFYSYKEGIACFCFPSSQIFNQLCIVTMLVIYSYFQTGLVLQGVLREICVSQMYFVIWIPFESAMSLSSSQNLSECECLWFANLMYFFFFTTHFLVSFGQCELP